MRSNAHECNFLLPVFAPVGFAHVFRPTHRECANTAFDTLRDDGVRQRVVEVCLTFGEFPAPTLTAPTGRSHPRCRTLYG